MVGGDGYDGHLARYALITVGEADHPGGLAHPKHDHGGQHLHAHPAEHEGKAGIGSLESL